MSHVYNDTDFMNFITHDTAYAIHPVSTFQSRHLLLGGDTQQRVASEYIDCGFQVIDTLAAETSTQDEFAIDRVRFVGDAMTWQLRLGGETLASKLANEQPDALDLGTCWNVALDQKEGGLAVFFK